MHLPLYKTATTMKLFNFLRKATTNEPQIYTAEDVTKDMTAMMFLFLTEMQQCVERKQMSQSLVKEKELLQSLGLSKTKNAQLITDHEKEIARYNSNVDCFLLMTEAWKHFGNDVMIVRYDQFMQLLEKYNLVCGDLSRYKGYIPEKNLQEIARIKGMDVPDKFAVDMEELEVVNLSFTVDELIKAIRFPYRPKSTNALDEMEIKRVGSYSSPMPSSFFSRGYLDTRFSPTSNPFLDIEARLRIMQEEAEMRAKIMREDENRRKAMIPRFFIAAPAQEMEPLDVRTTFMTVYDSKKSDAIKDFANVIQTRDPFFCSCTKYGVLIYSKWGDEAQDEIIKRYQTLSQTINN